MSHKFFKNKCKFYPCHDLKEINCLFCYCPLFNFKNCGGTHIILKDGTKDCSKCTYPHIRKNYNKIIKRLKEEMHGKAPDIKNTKE